MKKLFKFGWITLIVGLITWGIAYLHHGDKSIYFDHGRPVIDNPQKQLKSKQQFSQLSINATDTNVIITTGQKYSIKYTGNSTNQPKLTVDKGVASFKETYSSKEHLHFGFLSSSNSQLVITVPKNASLTGHIHLDDGDLTIGQVHLKKVDIHNDDGDLNLHKTTLEGGQSKLEDGDFNGRHLAILEHYTVRNEDGDNNVSDSQSDGYHLYTEEGTNTFMGHDQSHQFDSNSNMPNVLSLFNDDGDNIVR